MEHEQMTTKSSAHIYFNWAKERLDEMDATLALLEGKVGELRDDTRANAESALADMREKGDAFRQAIKNETKANEAAWNRTKAQLEPYWSAFETNVEKYVEAAGQQGEHHQAAFRARADAQRKAWQEAADNLHTAAAEYAADRTEVASAVKRMKADAEAAEAKLAKLSRAGTESWSALNTALAETRAAFDRANQVVYETLKRAE
jgi:hypothetical protein